MTPPDRAHRLAQVLRRHFCQWPARLDQRLKRRLLPVRQHPGHPPKTPLKRDQRQKDLNENSP
jgi:hypothetical protein